MENNNRGNYEALKNAIEALLGRKVATKRDYEYLSMRILDRTGSYLSPMTLRRFWGDLADGKYNTIPRRFTIDTLAQYTGYNNYEQFQKERAGEPIPPGSRFLLNDYVPASALKKGQQIQLSWLPQRFVTVEFLGYDMFKVVNSINSKLSKGDTFHVDVITQGEPLYLSCLVHEGGAPIRYVCGQNGGVKFRVLTNTLSID